MNGVFKPILLPKHKDELSGPCESFYKGIQRPISVQTHDSDSHRKS